MSALLHRLKKLERLTRTSPVCATCGHDPRFTPRLRLAAPDEALADPDHCQGCGRPLVLRLTFDSRD